MSGAIAAAAALVFVWLGMVLAISFVEAPLKFRAPGVTIPIGLGIGRMVFRVLNRVEAALAVAVVSLVAAGAASSSAGALTAVVAVVLAAQLGLVRPRLNRRSDLPRSRGHLAYVALELVKVAGLIALGVVLMA
jgi:hypothetical protein